MAISFQLLALAIVPLALFSGPVSSFLSSTYSSVKGAFLWRFFLFQLFRLWKLPAGPELDHEGHHLLILGSSVAKGEGAEAGPGPNLGWPARLAKALEAKVPAWRIHNRAVEYTTSQLWYDLVMNKTTPEEWKHYSLVILSLSVNNEGFLLTQEEEKLQQIEQHFLKHVRMTVKELRGRLNASARLVLAGPYANDGYSPLHGTTSLSVLQESTGKCFAIWEREETYVCLIYQCTWVRKTIGLGDQRRYTVNS
ncbi:unnamed protein product [Durusdinium trenchii]|uniref:SGNH hydrolase-type esterase domain-containing protein n=1 Tax=Durusdinium trenchii TaxID=1381693 RepID=A0ABP0I4Y2_9DINO